jgi:hypothetical protein
LMPGILPEEGSFPITYLPEGMLHDQLYILLSCCLYQGSLVISIPTYEALLGQVRCVFFFSRV